MRFIFLLIYFLFFSMNFQIDAYASNVYPLLVSKNTHFFECVESLKIAQETFEAKNFSMNDSLVFPQNSTSELLSIGSLGSVKFEKISEGSILWKKEPGNCGMSPDFCASVYWQKKSVNGIRWILLEEPNGFGCDGYVYGLFLAKESLTQEKFMTRIAEDSFKDDEECRLVSKEKKPYASYDFFTHVPPLLFENKEEKKIWVIYPISETDFSEGWYIYRTKIDENTQCIEKVGTIFFRKEGEVLDQLPTIIRNFANSLDELLGKGASQGSLAPIDKISSDIKNIWSVILYRPWALTFTPYNTRKKVDSELLKWAQKSPFNKKRYKKILKKYSEAENELRKYYQTNFDKTHSEAKKMARFAIDLVYRAYFVFPT